jgi:hypothetical protein
MTALRKILIEEEPVVTAAVTVARAPAPKFYVVPTAKAPADAPAEAAEAEGSILKNILLFFAAPFLGLAYIAALPFVGLGFLAVVAVRAAAKIEAVRTVGLALKNVVMAMATPFVGLAYVVFFPAIGLAMLACLGVGLRLEPARGKIDAVGAGAR